MKIILDLDLDVMDFGLLSTRTVWYWVPLNLYQIVKIVKYIDLVQVGCAIFF